MALPVLLVLLAASLNALPRGPQPAVRLKLADLGFPGISQAMQEAGASMLTTHFVDNTHVLLTYSLRGLVERIPDDPRTDDDRAVAALLVELPSGKVLARTRWHLHDHGQYLWSLGSGRFLLRVRSTLMAIAPLANLQSGEPFRQMPFVRVPGAIDAILIAPEGDLVTVEASPARKPAAEHSVLLVNSPEPKPRETIFFVRVSGIGSPESPVQASSAGSVYASGVGLLPVNGRGYLFARSEKHSRWAMQFDSFDGEIRKLAYVDSSCPPRMQFVSPSQYVVFSCRGADDKVMISAFNFASRESWEEPLSSGSSFASFAYAQQAGRFALSRTLSMAATPMPATAPGSALAAMTPVSDLIDPTTTQEVRVYQVESGDLLLKLACAPVSRNAQNFDLAADGLSVLAVHDGAIEVYPLPPPTARDKKELSEVQEHEPPLPHSSAVKLRRLLGDADENAMEAGPGVDEPPPVAAAVPVAAARPSVNAPATVGDVETPRKPPSLLNPGESVEDGKKAPK